MTYENHTTFLPAKFTWKSIEGWCDFSDIYSEQVAHVGNEPAIFVEVGSWFGQSTAFMAGELKRKNKPQIDFYAVDTWKGTPTEPNHMNTVAKYGGDIFEKFQENMRRCGVADWVDTLRMPSVEAAKKFKDGTIRFCFLDAAHDDVSVVSDIRAWLPKMRLDGVIAGHDVSFTGVRKAIEQEFAGKWRQQGQSWVVDHWQG